MPVGTSNYASIFFYLCQYILLPMPVGTSTNASRHILLPMPLITSTNTSINNMETTDPKLILFQFRDDCKSYLLLHLHQQSPAPLCSTYRNRIAALKVASLCIFKLAAISLKIALFLHPPLSLFIKIAFPDFLFRAFVTREHSSSSIASTANWIKVFLQLLAFEHFCVRDLLKGRFIIQ